MKSYVKSRGEQKKLVYFLSRDGVTYEKLRKNERNAKGKLVFLFISECKYLMKSHVKSRTEHFESLDKGRL